MNRSLRTLAEIGLLDQRRKAGTRVALHPISKATLSIPLIRNEIEASGKLYGYHLLSRRSKAAPLFGAPKIALLDKAQLLHVVALHEADGKPFVLEKR